MNTAMITPHKGSNPYESLYIYYLEGPVRKTEELYLGPQFLGNWVEEDSSFLFFSGPSREFVQMIVEKDERLRLIDEFHFTHEEWVGGVVETHRISRFLIVPPWEDVRQGNGELKMLLDPGVVFGTSLHPTTRHCLLALLEISERMSSSRVLDLGTGTGILAVGAALLGAKTVLAVDNNPLAVRTAARNVELNGLEQVVTVKEGLAEHFMDSPFDLLVANIHFEVILTLVKDDGFLQKRHFILSGLMRDQARSIKIELSRLPVEIIQEWDHDTVWHTIMGRVNN
ncbi:MAG: 50S ribosomal protein L11 methyltransferase [Deltaproteobacteria bacterium]|nr:50S ribosomal protein L11 methyltransferase [Deltaproteobacteria bacterium]MBW2310252.1 50S ribosomal protein L11 methyltransferase [Deltaproteobacteria bacterium]